MKTNKLILGILGAVAVVSTANAKKMTEARCLEQEGMVWVEKDEKCILANPCSWDNYDEDSVEYCKRFGGTYPVCGVNLDMLFGKFAQNVLNTSVSEYTLLEDEGPGNSAYYGVKTSDGGYFGVVCRNYGESKDEEILVSAAWTWGYNPAIISSVKVDKDLNPLGYYDKALQIVESISEGECSEIVSFAGELTGKTFNYKIDEESGSCLLLVPDPEYNQF